MKEPKSFNFISPGRVNLIGEHIDYCGGLVIPSAIDLGISFRIQKADDAGITFEHLDLGQNGKVSTSAQKDSPWLRYWISVLKNAPPTFKKEPGGMHIAIKSNLPQGAGLSSSSALTCGFIYALIRFYKIKLSRLGIIDWAIKSEHGAGVIGGQMDQTAIFFARKNAFMALDCSQNEWTYHPFISEDVGLVLFDSLTQHELINSEYNTRRKLTEEAKLLLLNEVGQSLADCSLQEVEEKLGHWTASDREKIRFIVEEQERSNQALLALQAKDWSHLGKIMTATHQGLSKQYGVSTPRLDKMVSCFEKEDQVLGCRMMGGGFGGCVLLLITMEGWKEIELRLQNQIKTELGFIPPAYRIRLVDGLQYEADSEDAEFI